jgi:hypothetical protein
VNTTTPTICSRSSVVCSECGVELRHPSTRREELTFKARELLRRITQAELAGEPATANELRRGLGARHIGFLLEQLIRDGHVLKIGARPNDRYPRYIAGPNQAPASLPSWM